MAKTLYEVEIDFRGTAWVSVRAESEDDAREKALDAVYSGEDVSYSVDEAYVAEVEEEFDQDDDEDAREQYDF